MSPPREPLSRERIARAALAYIDTNGLAALSMRKLGAELGVEAMSLYNHVANKDDLLHAVAEQLYDQILQRYQPDPGVSWHDQAREMVRAYREVAFTHPEALPLMGDRPAKASAGITFLDQCYRIFLDAGFDTKQAAMAFHTVGSWLIGAIRQELGLMLSLEAGEGFGPSDVPPHLAAVVEFKDACLVETPDHRFDYGLEVLLTGLDAKLAAETR